MPVGTQGTIKGLTIEQVVRTGAEMLLGNTYHLALRPGDEVVRQLGGLHAFIGWEGPLLTDSGGFQLFSLARLVRVDDQGAVFHSHIDGRRWELSPERSMRIQANLGSDVAMVLDDVVALPAEEGRVRQACERTIRWAHRCRQSATRHDQALFAIVQGGLDLTLRKQCVDALTAMDFDGYAIGGLSVGESPGDMYQVVEAICPVLPADRPRYLMGVGRPKDLLRCIRDGVDLFDCVMPTRNGRNALAFADEGPVRLRNYKHGNDPRPIDADCPCIACRHSRGYLRHLFLAKEMLGPILLTVHNLTYYQRLLAEARQAIVEDRYESFYQGRMRRWSDPPS
jgi:queuine tRNA-ribosyltransferase